MMHFDVQKSLINIHYSAKIGRTEAEAILALLDDTPIERIPEKPSNGNQMAREISDVEKNVEKYHLKIYPNPSNNKVHLTIENRIENVELSLINFTTGEVMKQEYFSSGSDFTLSVSDLANGVYLMELRTDDLLVGREKVVILK